MPKMYFNEKTGELYFRAQLIADLDEAIETTPHIRTVLATFAEESWPQSVYDPIPPESIATHHPQVQHRLHGLKVERVLRALNSEIRMIHDDPPLVFEYDPEDETIELVILQEGFAGGREEHPGIGE